MGFNDKSYGFYIVVTGLVVLLGVSLIAVIKYAGAGEAAGIITAARSAAAVPVIPSPGRIRGRRVMSATLVPCVARRTSSSVRSS